MLAQRQVEKRASNTYDDDYEEDDFQQNNEEDLAKAIELENKNSMLYNQNIIKNKPREKEQISFNNPLGNVGGGFVKN